MPDCSLISKTIYYRRFLNYEISYFLFDKIITESKRDSFRQNHIYSKLDLLKPDLLRPDLLRPDLLRSTQNQIYSKLCAGIMQDYPQYIPCLNMEMAKRYD